MPSLLTTNQLSRNRAAISGVGIIHDSRFPNQRYRRFAIKRYRGSLRKRGIIQPATNSFQGKASFPATRSNAVVSKDNLSCSHKMMESMFFGSGCSSKKCLAYSDCSEANLKYACLSLRRITFTEALQKLHTPSKKMMG